MKNIAVVMGGFSAEKVISLKSGEVVIKHLDCKIYNIYPVLIDENGWFLTHNNSLIKLNKNNFTATINHSTISFDCVFIAIHGTPGEDGVLQKLLESLNIPHTSSNHVAAELSFNKEKCNNFLRTHGIHCAQSFLITKNINYNHDEILSRVGLPCFVKPNKNGSSFGVSKVTNVNQLKQAIKKALIYDEEVLIESFLSGTEVTCGVNNFNGQLKTFPITEIVSENDFFDFEAKYKGKSKEITPARISENEASLVSETTKRVYQLLNLNGIARIDFIIQNGIPFVIEANTVPGLSEKSIIPQQAAYMNISLKELFVQAVEHALNK